MEDTTSIELLLSLLRVNAAQQGRDEDVATVDELYAELKRRGVIEQYDELAEMERP